MTIPDAAEASCSGELEQDVVTHLTVVRDPEIEAIHTRVNPPTRMELTEILLTHGLEEYRTTVDDLALDDPEQYNIVKELERLFGQLRLVDSADTINDQMDEIQYLQARLLAGNLSRVLDVAQSVKRAGHRAVLGALILEANKLAITWFKREYGTPDRVKLAPVFPTDILCEDYIRPNLTTYKPKPAQKRPVAKAKKSPEIRPKPVAVPTAKQANPAELVAIGHLQHGQGFLRGLLKPLRTPPKESIFAPPSEKPAIRLQIPGEISLPFPKPARELWNVGETKAGQTFLRNLLPSTENVPIKQTAFHEGDSVDPAKIKKLKGQMAFDYSEPRPRKPVVTRTPSIRPPMNPTPQTTREMADTPKPKAGGGGRVPLEDSFMAYRLDVIRETSDKIISNVVRYVLENDPAVDIVEIQRCTWADLSSALHICLHTEEYFTSQDPAIRHRFAQIAAIAKERYRSRPRSKKDEE